jgi:hypothetical protein
MVMHGAVRVGLAERLGIPRTTSVVLVLWETLLLLGGAAVLAPLAAGRSAPVVGALCLAVLVAFLPLARVGARALGSPLPAVPARTQLGLVAGYALVWLVFGVSFAATCRWFASGEDAGLDAALAFVAAYVAGLVAAVAPAGVGVREAVLVAALGTEDALAMALASRIAMTAVELALVGLSRLAPELAAHGR